MTGRRGNRIATDSWSISSKDTLWLSKYKPYVIPDSCRVWAREDTDAINFKTTLVEGPRSGETWFGELRGRNQLTRSSVQELLIHKVKVVSGICHYLQSKIIVTELWYNPRKIDENASTSSKKSFEVSEQDPQAKRLEIEPRQGQKRPAQPGGESQPSRESRVASAQASHGVKRQAEDVDDSERIRDLPDVEKDLSALIDEHRELYLESIEGQDEPVYKERIPLPPELHDEASTWWYYDDISGEVLDT